MRNSTSRTAPQSRSIAVGSPSQSHLSLNPQASRAQSTPSLPSQQAGTDPCAPSPATMQAKATPEPSRNSTAALVSLVTRAKSQRSTATDPDHTGALTSKLWSSRISAPGAGDDAEASLALKRLIRQVHSLTVKNKNAVQSPAPSAEPVQAAQPPAAVPTNEQSVAPAQAQAAAPPAAETAAALPPQAQKTLDGLRKNPGRVGDPLETAELLFLSGRPADAVPFYEEALRRTRAGEVASAGDRAWILFQLGNCLRETDAAKAQEAYLKLIAEFPNSPWTEMARAGGRLLTWYQSTRPDQLMAARK